MPHATLRKALRRKNADLHGSAPDKSEVALILVDVINDLDFPEAKQLTRFIPALADSIARLKKRAKAAGVPVINPVAGAMERAAGNPAADQVYGGVPPVAVAVPL